MELQGENPVKAANKTIEQSEFGLADELCRLYFDTLKFVTDHERWYKFNGKIWVQGSRGDGYALLSAKNLINTLYSITSNDYFFKSKDARTVSSVVRVAKPEMSVPASVFDSNKNLLNVENGVLELLPDGNHSFREHRAEDMLTHTLNTTYDENATCPTYDIFRQTTLVDKSLAHSEDLDKYLHRFLGYSLTCSREEQVYLYLIGDGDNGKSVLVDTISHIFGAASKTGYANSCLPEELALGKREGGGPNETIARLAGCRLALCSEMPKDERWQEAALKRLVTDLLVTARYMYGHEFSFEAQHKIIFSGNHMPSTRDQSEGFWRRARVIPFNKTFSREERDRGLLEKLKLEAPGILNRLLEGYKDWKENGLGSCELVKGATEDYKGKSAEGTPYEFVDDYIEREDGNKVRTAEVFGLYQGWCEEQGTPRMAKQRILNQALQERGYVIERSRPPGCGPTRCVMNARIIQL
jgi:putative DNA primase/helicase